MSLLPRASELIRERVYRQMDDLGPAGCTGEMLHRLRRENPELVEIARMQDFALICRRLVVQSTADRAAVH